MKEVYDSKVRTDTYKLQVNDILRELARKQKHKGKAVILDSDKLVTRDILLDAGYKVGSIHIPNPFSYKSIRKSHTRTYDMLLGDYLDKVINRPFTFAFFDYCSSLNGNKIVKPIKDIQKYFYNCNPEDGSILAVTVSIRNKGDSGKFSTLTNLHSLITKSAYESAYSAVLLQGMCYHGMYFAVYKIYNF